MTFEDFLKKYGLEIEDMKGAKAEFFKSFKSTGEVEAIKADAEKLKAEVETLKGERDQYKGIADKFEGQNPEELESLKKDLAAMKQAEKDREEKAKADARASQFEQMFDTALGDKKFSNSLIRSSVLEAVRKERESDAASGLSDLIDRVTKDQDGIFVNPNKPKPNPLPTDGVEGKGGTEKVEGALDDDIIRRITGLPDDAKV